MTPQEVVQFARDNEVEFVDLRFAVFAEGWRHHTVPVNELTLQWIRDGLASDSASIRALGQLLSPVTETAALDPFYQHPTLALICELKDPVTRQDYARDPRAVARRAQTHLSSSGIADQALFAPELTFFVFDQACYDQGMNAARYQVDSREGIWRRGRDEADNLGNQLRVGEGRFRLPPSDSLHNLRSEMSAALGDCGIQTRGHYRAAATGGQAAISLAAAQPVQMADQLMTCKYVLRNVAARHGKVVTFMPKPLYQEVGSSLSAPLSLWKAQQPLVGAENGEGLSEIGLWAVGGVLRHAESLLALTCPTTNSYKRLVPGFEAPTRLAYTHEDPSAVVRVPAALLDRNFNWIEFRASDPMCDPYLALSALLMAALDGIENRIDPGPPQDQRPDGRAGDAANCRRLPRSLEEALRALEADHDYLLKGGVFTEDLVRGWITHKQQRELIPMQERPHPYEFCLYFDA